MNDSKTSLYRHFASDGSLLYVGISLSWPARTKAHSQSSRWFEQVDRVEIEHFPSRAAALDAEREAIKSECPKFNVAHNRGAPAQTVTARGGRRRRQVPGGDPVLEVIRGPHAVVGPPLIYRGDTISVMVAHGEFGTRGELTEIVLGERFPETPAWAEACASVITIRRPNEITLAEARGLRQDIIERLRGHLQTVQVFGTDLALAVAYASQFPSDKSRQILDEVAIDRGAAA